jgi:hypothetical protein
MYSANAAVFLFLCWRPPLFDLRLGEIKQAINRTLCDMGRDVFDG